MLTSFSQPIIIVHILFVFSWLDLSLSVSRNSLTVVRASLLSLQKQYYESPKTGRHKAIVKWCKVQKVWNQKSRAWFLPFLYWQCDLQVAVLTILNLCFLICAMMLAPEG